MKSIKFSHVMSALLFSITILCGCNKHHMTTMAVGSSQEETNNKRQCGFFDRFRSDECNPRFQRGLEQGTQLERLNRELKECRNQLDQAGYKDIQTAYIKGGVGGIALGVALGWVGQKLMGTKAKKEPIARPEQNGKNLQTASPANNPPSTLTEERVEQIIKKHVTDPLKEDNKKLKEQQERMLEQQETVMVQSNAILECQSGTSKIIEGGIESLKSIGETITHDIASRMSNEEH